MWLSRRRRSFQSAPHFSSEANDWLHRSRAKSQVSIRASLQQRGEPQKGIHYAAAMKFQSAPHFSSEANTGFVVSCHFICFNPRLTSAARRTSHASLFGAVLGFQSAPHFSSEANSVMASLITARNKFQSAPHFSSEANAGAKALNPVRRSFNPRLTSAARRTYSRGLREAASKVSIRASLQQRGEHRSPENLIGRKKVSIRASLQQRGERGSESVESGET